MHTSYEGRMRWINCTHPNSIGDPHLKPGRVDYWKNWNHWQSTLLRIDTNSGWIEFEDVFLAQNAQDVGKNHFFLLPTKKLTILQGSFKDFFFGFRLIRPKNYSLQNHMLNMYSTKMKLQYHQSYKPKRKFCLFILRL